MSTCKNVDRNGSSVAACDDPLLLMHHLGHQAFPNVKYKQTLYDGITSSFEASTDCDAVSSTDLEWTRQDLFGMETKQIQSDGVTFSFCTNSNFDVACTHYETSQILTGTSVIDCLRVVVVAAAVTQGNDTNTPSVLQSHAGDGFPRNQIDC